MTQKQDDDARKDDAGRAHIHAPDGVHEDDAEGDYIHCLSAMFPNSDDDPVEHIYTKDHNGRVVGVETSFKVPRNEIVHVETRNATTGEVLHAEVRYKKDVDKYFTKDGDPNPDFPEAHHNTDDNETYHYRVLQN